MLEESLPPNFLLLLVTIKGTLTNPLAEKVEEAWSDSLRLRAGRVEDMEHHVVHGVEEVEPKGVGPEPPATLARLVAEKVTEKLRIFSAVARLACRVQEVDIEGIAVYPSELVVHVHAKVCRHKSKVHRTNAMGKSRGSRDQMATINCFCHELVPLVGTDDLPGLLPNPVSFEETSANWSPANFHAESSEALAVGRVDHHSGGGQPFWPVGKGFFRSAQRPELGALGLGAYFGESIQKALKGPVGTGVEVGWTHHGDVILDSPHVHTPGFR